MQKNIHSLPTKAFDEIEDIIVSKNEMNVENLFSSNPLDNDMFGLKKIQ